jgi:hypothetical protein
MQDMDMSKPDAAVLFFGPLTLNPGVKGGTVERFYVEKYLPNVAELPGYTLTLYKGCAGKRAGQYLYIGYFENAARSQQLFPTTADGRPSTSEEWQQWVAANPVWVELMIHFDYTQLMAAFSEYVEIGR